MKPATSEIAVAVPGHTDQEIEGRKREGRQLVFQHARSETAAVITEGAGAIVREQVFLQVKISEEDPDTIEIQLFARKDYVVFALELPEDEELPPTCWDRCCTGSRDPCHACTVQRVFNTNNLKRARNWGIEIIRSLLFPLFSKFGSEIFSTTVLFIAAVSVILALPTLIREAMESRLRALEIVRFATSLAFLFLAALDFVYSIRSCLLGRAILSCCCKRFGTNTKKATGSHKQTIRGCCCKLPDFSHINPGNIQTEMKEQTKWKQIKHFFTKYMLDIVRVLIVETLIYPSVICDILDNASNRTYRGTTWEKFVFARFTFTAAKIIVLVYIVRLLVIGTTVMSLESIRRGGGFVEPTDNTTLERKKGCFSMFNEHDGKRRARKALVLEIFFLLHVFGQMLTQGLMLGAIWAKVEFENPNLSPCGVVFISPFTWTMIVLGFILPIAGTFTFFVSTYVWTQEFPVDFMITMLSALKKSNIFESKKRAMDNVQKIEKIVKKVESDLGKRKLNVCFKIFFPFYTPHLSIISCLYDVALLSFAVFFFVGQVDSREEYITCNVFQNQTSDAGSIETESLIYSYGWLLYYLIGVSLVNVANILVVVIGLWWMVIVPMAWPLLFVIICPAMCIWQAILKPIIKSCKEGTQPISQSAYAPNR